MITVTHQIDTYRGLIAVEIDVEIHHLGCEPSRWHDGDDAEMEIGEVRVEEDTAKPGSPIHDALIALLGRDEVEADALRLMHEERQLEAAEAQWLDGGI